MLSLAELRKQKSFWDLTLQQRFFVESLIEASAAGANKSEAASFACRSAYPTLHGRTMAYQTLASKKVREVLKIWRNGESR